MIELRSICKKFDDKVIFNDLNYKFNKNKLYVLSGESGIGKTTLLNIIFGYDNDFQGSCLIDKDIKVAYMFQDDLLFSNITVLENLKLFYLANHNDLDLFSNCVESVISKIGINDLLNKKVQTLSGGEKQRVKLAQILLINPEVILFDEPISNLDKLNIEKICSLIDSISSERTMIIVSHSAMNLNTPTQNLVLRDGKIYEK